MTERTSPSAWGWLSGLPGSLLGGMQRAAADVLPVRIGGTEFARTPSTPARLLGFDQGLVWVTVALLMWGLVMVYSTTIAMPDNPKFANYAHPHVLCVDT
eukprot:Opistho-2@20500